MHDSNFTRASGARRIPISALAAAAFLAGAAANASTPAAAAVKASGSATVHWTIPTTNTDGSGLSDLAGYSLYYGTSPSSMTTSITVASPGTTSYTIGNLARGTWYFTLTAYTTDSPSSARSNIASKSVR
ncbi:MAG: fibronectin type III domain-containing protein [Steroidobacteraceae bacterium]